jgi:hypothetical protein
MPNSIILGKQAAGGNITFSPGKPSPGGKEGGAIIWCAADQTTELMRLDAQGLHLFGQLVPKDRVIELLQQLHQKACTCSTQQILQQGCVCGGS